MAILLLRVRDLRSRVDGRIAEMVASRVQV